MTRPSVLLALLLLTTSACQSSQSTTQDAASSYPLHHVERGMTPGEVQQVLGPPRETISSKDTVQWMEYGTSTHRVRIYFEDEQVEAIPSRLRRAVR